MKPVCIALLAGMIACAFSQPASAVHAAKYTEKVVWSFGSGTDGSQPVAGLIDVKGMLYGTTGAGGGSGRGAVFTLDPSTGAENVLYSFCSQQNCTDGADPGAGLIDTKGVLYGTTEVGGANGRGTVFSLDPGTGNESALYSFCSQQNCADGAAPQAGVIDVNGTLYGTTFVGNNIGGTVFSLDPGTGAETVLYSFCSQMFCTDGFEPAAGVIDVKDMLYGTTSQGGANTNGCNEEGCGEVFSVDPDTGAETVIHSFGDGADGQIPLAGLIDVNGTLYGTTDNGGANTNHLCNGWLGIDSCGAVFALNPKTGKEKAIYSFCSLKNCKDGANPVAGLIAVRGTLYGTTTDGGSGSCNGFGCGTVFSIDPKTGVETVLYSFAGGGDGANPQAGLINVKGSLYGTTFEGGGTGCNGGGCGTVFVLTKK
ncbi:MAG: choice-of-anchor tandem repeat GloVer-containing protein [Rhizomicrobium sp.]|jgi:uncharacterized repeat protein (TIGR03803 family)